MKKHKILWVDRNVHRFDLSGMLSAFSDVEVSFSENVEDAISQIQNHNFNLIISGNRFEDGQDGISFFKTISSQGLRPQFLLLTGEWVPKEDPCFLLQNFTYARKEDMTPELFRSLIEELLSKGTEVSDLHLRLRAIRLYFKLSENQFASLLGSSLDKVMEYEAGKEVPSSYVVSVCNTFNVPLSYFSSFSYELFLKRMDELAYELKQRARQ